MSLLYFKVSIASDMYCTCSCSATYRLNMQAGARPLFGKLDVTRRELYQKERCLKVNSHKQGSCSNPGTSELIVEFEDMAPGKKT